jgi:3-phenylpropionate/cinnamic acid dioxygenase small subunit
MAGRIDAETYLAISEFLLQEAELLDDRQYDQWLALLTDDVEYLVPIRQTVAARDGAGFDPEGAWMRENRASLEARLRRLQGPSPWAEDPPSRGRHFVCNVRGQPGDRDDEVRVKSNLWLYRSRGGEADHEVFSAERQDLLRRVNGEWKLARRVVLLDHAALNARDVSLFF